jgi:protoporphyrinogen/coproporphyrinogen III oxidase
MYEPHALDAPALVIGAGISGLATAFGLEQHGIDVCVLDARAEPGGVIATRRRDGALYETGPNSTLDTTPLIDELLVALGIRDERVEAASVASIRYIVRDAKLVPLPTSPPKLLTTPAFTLGAKLRLLREPFIAPAAPDIEESIAQFVRRRLGAEFLDYAIDPFVSGVYAGDPEAISVPAAFPRLHALEQKYGSLIGGQIKGARARRQSKDKAKNAASSFSFRDGMQTLPAALARAIGRVQCGVRVQRVTREADGTWTIEAARGADSIALRARSVVVATPAYVASTLVEAIAPKAAAGLASIEYAAVASVASLYRRSDIAHALAGFGFLVPKKEARRILGTLFSSSMFPGRAPEGSVLLTTFVGGRRNPVLVAHSDDELATIVHDELAALIGAKAKPQWTEITRWSHAIPQYNLGHRERLHTVDAAERALPGLFFCANYRGGISVGDCIKSAHAMAERVAASVGRSATAAKRAPDAPTSRAAPRE